MYQLATQGIGDNLYYAVIWLVWALVWNIIYKYLDDTLLDYSPTLDSWIF